MKLLNSLAVNGVLFGLDDVRGFIPREKFGLPEGYYGGRVTQVAKTDVDGLYLCMENMTPIDILIIEEEFKGFIVDVKEAEYDYVADSKAEKESDVGRAPDEGVPVEEEYTKDEKRDPEADCEDIERVEEDKAKEDIEDNIEEKKGESDYSSMRRSQLIEILESKNISYSKKAVNAELIKLLEGEK